MEIVNKFFPNRKSNVKKIVLWYLKEVALFKMNWETFMVYQDPSQNYIYEFPHPLESIFLPKSIAVIGAKDTPGSVGRTIISNLLAGGFSGTIVGVNPKRTEVLGIPCYPNIKDVPQKIDLVVIVVPANFVPQVMKECVEAGVLGAIVISAGFKEMGAEGLRLEQELLKEAKKGNIRIIGPNCLGVMNPSYGLNASFAKGMALNGSIAFISQSGAMCTAVLDWSFQTKIGFSAFVSIGSMADVNWGDLIEYFGQDSKTRAILMYMETVGDPVSFMSAAREVALDKPIIVIKPGKSQEAQKAAASHTGSLSGSDDVFEAACQRAGVLRVESISQLFSMAEVLATQPKPRGPNLAIVTNAGGPSVLATDSAIQCGAHIPALSQNTVEALNEFLPKAWSHGNPIDLLGDATPDEYGKACRLVAQDPNIDGLLVVLSPQDMTDPEGTSRAIAGATDGLEKPLIASWMGGLSVEKGRELLHTLGIPSFEYPDDAAWSFSTMWRYSQLIKGLYETPIRDAENINIRQELRQRALQLFSTVRASGRTLLTEEESKLLFELYGIPVVETLRVTSVEEAMEVAESIGFPVVLKLHSETISHKSDVGGVQLNLQSPEAVKAAYFLIQKNVIEKFSQDAFQGVTVQRMADKTGVELIIGSSRDPQFGPIVLFGAGGIYVEIMKDRALGLPPLQSTVALQMMKKTKIIEALRDFRGSKAVPLEKIASILVKFSEMIADNPEIIESDMNPLLASDKAILALDGRCVIASEKEEASLAKTALRPYPIQYVFEEKLNNGDSILIRPISPEDEHLIVEFHKELSENSVRQRYFEFVSLDKRIAHERLIRICFSDFNKEIALVAESIDPVAGPKIIGVIRFIKAPAVNRWYLKLIIVDSCQGQGVGKLLFKKGLEVAKKEDVQEIYAHVLEENVGMIALLKANGATCTTKKEGAVLEFQL